MTRRLRLPAALACAALLPLLPSPALAARRAPPRASVWKIIAVTLDGTMRFTEEDRGYTGTASYRGGNLQNSPTFSLAPASKANPRLFTTVFRPARYSGQSNAVIREIDRSWDCSLTTPEDYNSGRLPVTIAVTDKIVHFNFTVIAPPIKCPDNAPAWTFGMAANKGRNTELELRSLSRVKPGKGYELKVDMRAQGTEEGVAYDTRWRGRLTLFRVR
ncbi:hypothetical protein [Conexibacter woesei]|uniref:Uncharacterized protein n=1 Tax=Conexibacter woesei (strain DSM 14684 / CCUG 47730 / CIP 108061 / JCM 11494 / NBRC 100937 / ID131577) TaxID=469383 RepID=D3FCR5_CONWI|nr:hypothetical protein [Conexibacter woesei]ADB49538.1 hypothetical protein Cwoe_1106 [Conexibacter woesei DSM 14684]